MTASEDFASVVNERNDRNDWITARNALHDALETINVKWSELKAMADAGIISDAPDDLKASLVWAYQELAAFRKKLIDNAEYMALHNWTP